MSKFHIDNTVKNQQTNKIEVFNLQVLGFYVIKMVVISNRKNVIGSAGFKAFDARGQ